MTNAQRTEIKEKLQELSKADLVGYIQGIDEPEGKPKKKATLGSKRVGPIAGDVFARHMQRMITQLNALLDNEDVWPYVEIKIGQGDVVKHLGTITNIISQRLYHNSNRHVFDDTRNEYVTTLFNNTAILIKYLHQNHYWQEPELQTLKREWSEAQKAAENFKVVAEELEALRNHLREQQEAYQAGLEGQVEQKKALQEELKKVGKQVQEYQDLYKSTKGDYDYLYNAEDEARSTLSEVRKYRDEAKEQTNKVDTTWQELEGEIKKLLTAQKTAQKEWDKATKAYEQQKQNVDGFAKQIENKAEEITQLTGLATDKALTGSFSNRSQELAGSVRKWSWLLLGTTLATLAWIMALLTSFFTTWDLPSGWDAIVVNLLRTSPAFILLGFALRQYGKERTLQEEYAFKAAVAATLNTYLDKINREQDEHTKQLLAKTLEDVVYHKPYHLIKGPETKSEDNPTGKQLIGVVEELVKKLKP